MFRHGYPPQSAVCYTTDLMIAPFQNRFVELARASARRSASASTRHAESLSELGLSRTTRAGCAPFASGMVEACAPLVAVGQAAGGVFRAPRAGRAGGPARHRRAGESHGTLVIIDAKRGDIASTAAAYGEAFLGPDSAFGGDAIDGQRLSRLRVARRRSSTSPGATAAGVFVVVRSSNPEGADMQRARMPDGLSVAEHLADDITARNAAQVAGGLGPIGAVRRRAPSAKRPSSLVPTTAERAAAGPRHRRARRDHRGCAANFGAHYARVIPSISRGDRGRGPRSRPLRRRVERIRAEIRASA